MLPVKHRKLCSIQGATVIVLAMVSTSILIALWFSYGETKLAQGRDAVKKLLDDNPELAEEIKGNICIL